MEDFFAGLSDSLVPESAFDEAFDRLDPADRAWIKKNIAQLHALYAHGGCTARREEREWSQGFQSRLKQRPFSRAVVCFPSSFLSSPRLIAAVVPPLAAGVQRCCAVRIGGGGASWEPRLLGGLELAGVEEVYDPDRERFRQWSKSVAGDPKTRIVFLEEPAEGSVVGSGGGGPVLLPEVDRLGIWFDNEEQWDLDQVRKAHPGAHLLLSGPAAPSAEYPRERVVEGSEDELFAADPDALFVPSSLFDKALSRCCRVFGPGQEACWIWPELRQEAFLRSALCLSHPDTTP
ncbi:MAG: hypothetical protein V5A74_11040 [Desulfohalobiaceae bacterium]